MVLFFKLIRISQSTFNQALIYGENDLINLAENLN